MHCVTLVALALVVRSALGYAALCFTAANCVQAAGAHQQDVDPLYSVRQTRVRRLDFSGADSQVIQQLYSPPAGCYVRYSPAALTVTGQRRVEREDRGRYRAGHVFVANLRARRADASAGYCRSLLVLAYGNDCHEKTGLTATMFADTACAVDAGAGAGTAVDCGAYLTDTLGHPTVPKGRTAGVCTCYEVHRHTAALDLTRQAGAGHMIESYKIAAADNAAVGLDFGGADLSSVPVPTC